jgi:hypothetical protein
MWIMTAWQHISPEVTVTGSKKCCITNAVNETDNDMSWNGSEGDGNVMGECKDHGTDCKDGDKWH